MIDRKAWLLAASIAFAAGPAHADDKTLILGCSLPLSGPLVGFGQPIEQGASLAVEQFDAAHTMPGVTFKLDCNDSQGDAKETVNIAEKLIDNPAVIASISDFTSTATMAAADTYARGGLVEMTPSASHPDLVKMNQWMFRSSETVPTYVDPLADFMTKTLGAKKIAVIQVQTDWGQSVGSTFVKQATADGAEIVDDAIYNQGTSDFRAILTRLRREHPDGIFLAMLEEEAATFMKQRKQLGLTGIPVVDSGVGLTERSLSLAGDAFDGLYSSRLFNPASPSPAVQDFIKAFTAKYGKAPDIWSAYGYDAANLLMLAAKRAGPNVTRDQERQQLLLTGRYDGANGTLAINPKTREIERFSLTPVRVENGKIDYDLKGDAGTSSAGAPAKLPDKTEH
jgi:branched-chain amino acid transport system substrate-binding protein